MTRDELAARFEGRFGGRPDVMSVAPGRINLIGEHTDYNDGFVFPVAIDVGVYVAARNSRASVCELYSKQRGKGHAFSAAAVEAGQVKGWATYAAGMAWAIREAGHGAMPNIQAYVNGDVPIGSGVSSSAALEMAFGVAWNEISGANISNKELAILGQRCENGFVGVKSGLMDQMASAMGKAGCAMLFDTRSLDIEYVPMPSDLRILLCDTKKPRALTSSAYNERRSQCEEAARLMGVPSLRDADIEMLEAAKSALSDIVYRRARHVTTENDRCRRFVGALESGDKVTVGNLMRQSHESLRDDYEVSCPELDRMAEACWSAPGCVGARMTGAGFGGACVALVQENGVEEFKSHVQEAYEAGTGIKPALVTCNVVAGAHEL